MNLMEVMPEGHARFLERALPELQRDERLVGVAAGGSFITGTMDEFSDIDLVIIVGPPSIDEVMQERTRIASRLGCLVDTFTGEHVGEPRLLICLYDQPVLHVDLKFVSLADVIESLSFLRTRVLGPLSLMEAGAQPSGVRKIETLAPTRARELAQTVASYDRQACVTSLQAAIAMYISLRDTLRNEHVRLHSDAQRVALDYLHDVMTHYV